MSNELAQDERTPLLLTHDTGGPANNAEEEDPRLIIDAVTRIISAVSLDSLVPSDILRLNSPQTELSDIEANPSDYAYALAALLYCRTQKVKERTAVPLDLYSQWTQEKSSEGDIKLLDRHAEVLWKQFLASYRTDQEIDTVLWSKFRKDASSSDLLGGQFY